MKKKKKISKKNKKAFKVNTKTIIITTIVIFALISITATYAWLSLIRQLEIVGFNVKIEIAEKLEISLDGETWTNSINIENMRQLYGTYRDRDNSTEALQASRNDQRNYVPIEILPVSTVGNIENGNLVFVTGNLDGKKLTDIKKCSEEDITKGTAIRAKEANNNNHPYLAFDIYLRNLSRLNETGMRDLLQLNEGSMITATKEGTGLEHGIRVGFVLYDSTVDLAATGAQARAIQANGNEKVAIWEPNYKSHTSYIIKNDERINSKLQEIETYAIKDNVGGAVPTQIEDITNYNDAALEEIYTNKAPQLDDIENETQLPETTEIFQLKEIDGTTNLSLEPNSISKVRVYIWLEGQDPDCIDLSSTGQQINATIRLIKPEYRQTVTNTYT